MEHGHEQIGPPTTPLLYPILCKRGQSDGDGRRYRGDATEPEGNGGRERVCGRVDKGTREAAGSC
ncbi:hypothetical protein X777_04364 [Ooceraea biroi]|uniref:Uncharacterized protein n=1 Tax=Ooceraea biroi TaxID=2015173 RepID=A0A026WHF4_OOCBI|nr:hypothetical protein X777_04364 [Ooceraea biroi]